MTAGNCVDDEDHLMLRYKKADFISLNLSADMIESEV